MVRSASAEVAAGMTSPTTAARRCATRTRRGASSTQNGVPNSAFAWHESRPGNEAGRKAPKRQIRDGSDPADLVPRWPDSEGRLPLSGQRGNGENRPAQEVQA